MRITTLSRILLSLTVTVAPVVAYNGAPGGGITITYPTGGAVINQGSLVTITWTTSGLTSPLVAIKLLSLTNDVPNDSNSISIANFVSTGDHSYNWTVGQSFGGGNVIAMSSIGPEAYSPSFTVVTVTTVTNATSSLPPTTSPVNTTSSHPPNSTTISSPTLKPTTPSTTALSSTSSNTQSLTTTNSTSNDTLVDTSSSSSSSSSVPIIIVASAAGAFAFAATIFFALRRTRRRRRPVSMALMLSEQSEPDWQPPEWTQHNQTPSFRKPPAADYAGYAYTPSTVFNGHPYPPQTYASSAGTSWQNNGPPAAAVAGTSSPLMPTPIPTATVAAIAAAPTVPEEAYHGEKTAVANVGLKDETDGAPLVDDLEGVSNKPDEKE